MKLVLGSQSEWRKNILRGMGYDFDVMASDIDEKSIRTDDYRKLPLMIARAKMAALEKTVKEPAILLTLDEIAIFEEKILEKPKNKKEARETLSKYSHNKVDTITGIFTKNTKSGKTAEGVDMARVYFKNIPENVVDQLIEKGFILKCAGSFEIMDEILQKYVEKINGTIESVAGMPKELVRKLIDEVKT